MLGALSTLAVLLLSLVSPLAAFFLATDHLAVHFTSVAYMEAIPLAASVGAVLAFRRSASPRDRWFWLSAAALGLTAAGKFTYLPGVVVVILYLAVMEQGPRWRTTVTQVSRELPWRAVLPYFVLAALCAGVLLAVGRPRNLVILPVVALYAFWEKWAGHRALVETAPVWLPWRALLPYFGVAGLVFWLLNPSLWHEPLSRLVFPITNQQAYLQSGQMELWPLPWFMPIAWLTVPIPWLDNPWVHFYSPPGALIFLLALAGLKREWRERRWVVIWQVTALLVALFWPAKWAQYSLPIVPPLCLMAASTLAQVWSELLERTNRFGFQRFGGRAASPTP